MSKFKHLLILSMIMFLTSNIIHPGWHNHDHPDFKERREKMKKYRTWKMTEYLELTPEQSQTFFPKYNQFEKRMHEKGGEIRKLVLKIDSMLQKENIELTDADYRKYRNQLLQLEKDRVEMKKEFLQSIDELLNTEQKIKYLIFDDKFKHDMMKKIWRKHFHRKQK